MQYRERRRSEAGAHAAIHIGDGLVIPRRLGQPWVGEVVPNVFHFGTTYISCYAIEDAGAYTFIDTGLPGYWEQIFGFLASRNAPLSAVHAVVLTHHHADHIGNAERLRKEAGAKVLIHSLDRAPVLRKAKPPTYLFPIWKPHVFKYMLHAMRAGASRTLPVVEATAFVDEEVLALPGHPRVIHVPGHTAGCRDS